MLKARLTLLLWIVAVPHVVFGQAEMVQKLEAACTKCHGLGLIAQQRLDRSAWTREMDKMMRWGAVVADADKDGLISYLARSFNSSRPVPNTFKAVPAGKGSDVFQTYCLSCHNDSLITPRKLDRAGWAAQVAAMIKLGAYVPGPRRDELLDYLTAHFGK